MRQSYGEHQKWDLLNLKVLSLQRFPDPIENQYPDLLQMMAEVWSVPILDLTKTPHGIPSMEDLGRRILRGQLNPVVILPPYPLRSPRVFDPLDLWPQVHVWANAFVDSVRTQGVYYETWTRNEADIRAIPSARLPHLVRYYRLAGLPQPAGLAATLYPNEERMLPKRSILARASRWFRRGR